ICFLFLFQTFLFGIARDAMTEPLACFVLCVAIYLYTIKRFFWMAFIVSLLPLARPELILLLPLWAWALVKEKKYVPVLFLGSGMLLWWAAWFFYTGDSMALFAELTKTGNSPNRYGQTSIWHHLGKYIYVTGPSVFVFLLLAILHSIRKIGKDPVVYFQFIAGFLIYVVFSSFLSLGQSGGALRNLITLSPFAALIALDGINTWIRSAKRNTSNADEKKTAPIKVKKNKSDAVRVTKGACDKDNHSALRWGIAGGSIIFLFVTGNYLTQKLVLRQNYDPAQKDYTVFLCCLVITIIILFLYRPTRRLTNTFIITVPI